jgi:cyclic pyranopterin phosphate synthase
VTKVRVTGGEPLVRKGILGFIRELSSIKGLKDLSLTTNGVLLKGFAQKLKEAGLQRINVSLDSLNRERFEKLTRGDSLSDVLVGIDAALEAGLKPVKINMVVIKGFNDDEITEFAKISKEKAVHVRFIEYMPFDTVDGWQREKCISSGAIKALIEKTEQLYPIENNGAGFGPARRFRFKDAPGEVGFISPVSEHFCGECNRLRLTADGKLRTCLFSDNEIDLRKALRDGSTDEAVEALLFKAVGEKPLGHRINENIFKKCSKTMSLIGG